MRKTILHLSDVHFGTHHAPDRARALLRAIEALAPDVVAVSGDLTQRATPRQFREARAFLDSIAPPKVVVPGNHDVPLWNVLARFAAPLARYRRFIATDLEPRHVDDVVAVLGFDTTRSLTVKNGRVGKGDLEALEGRLAKVPASVCRVLVCHHPLAATPAAMGESAARGGAEALARLARAGVDVVLSGHVHESHAVHSGDLFPDLERGVLLVSAGSATSVRGRRTERARSSFNTIVVTPERLVVMTYLYDDEGRVFAAGEPRPFPRHGHPALAREGAEGN